jgi:DNA polymerase/3'-5' exonuclease PolX
MKKDLDPALALDIANDFESKTKDLYSKVEIGGSLRRKERVVHDIDFAVIPSVSNFIHWKDEISDRVKSIGGEVVSVGEVISDFLYMGVQVNLFICPGEDSWGVTLMWATGPKGHTIGMTIKARNLGLLYNSQGIWTRDTPPKLIPARDEMEVARILHWKYKPPESRGKGGKEKEFH